MDQKTRDVLEVDAILSRLAEYAQCSLGSDYVRALEPAEEVAEVEARLSRVREIITLHEGNRKLPLAGLQDVEDLLDRADLEGSALDPADWPRMLRVLETMGRLTDFARENQIDFPALCALIALLRPNAELRKAIERVFDKDGLIRDDASPGLARARAELRRTEQALQRTVQKLLGDLRGTNVLQEEFSTLRNGRHVLPVRAGSRGRVKGIVHGSSTSGETLYVEPLEIVESSNEVEVARQRELQEIHRIMLELTVLLRPAIGELREDLITLAMIDGAKALGANAFERGWRISVVTERGAMRLRAAHHPLLHMTRAATSVPITLLMDNADHIIVLSGPNTGGKTTAMKTIALSAVLLQCGCPIPASPDSTIPIYRGFHADIGDQQDLGEGISTFSGHLRRVKEILELADEDSLVLLDELGTGTDPEEGGALAQALLEDLGKRAALTITTSHLGPLKLWAEQEPGARNASFSLDASTRRPTYVIRLDLPGASEALSIAEHEGLPASILDRAKGLVGGQKLAMGDLLRRIEDRERRLGASLREAEARALSLDEQERIARARAEELREERKEQKRRAIEERENAVREAREHFEKLIADLPGENDLRRRKQLLSNARKDARTEQERLSTEKRALDRTPAGQMKGIRVGKKVYVRAFDSMGEIMEVLDEGKRARVQVGVVSVVVGTDGMLESEPVVKPKDTWRSSTGSAKDDEDDDETAAAPNRPRKSKRLKEALKELSGASEPSREIIALELAPDTQKEFRRHRQEALPMQLDLHGFRVEEALEALDRYLDRALLAGYPHVRIIHGTGEGKLYRAVHEHLRAWPHRPKPRFRFANGDEGGAGVTIVEF